MPKSSEPVLRVALAGNPNVGKSTVFNALTGLHQHTGNWAGKTVSNARGLCRRGGRTYDLSDLPGTYSLLAHSAEEAVARDAICFEPFDAVVVVCDATGLWRNLPLLLQILEITPQVALCVNLMDEAKKRHIRVDVAELSLRLGIPAVGVSARARRGADALLPAIDRAVVSTKSSPPVCYPDRIEQAATRLASHLAPYLPSTQAARFAALRLLEGEESWRQTLLDHVLLTPEEKRALNAAVSEERAALVEAGITVRDVMSDAVQQTAEEIYCAVVKTDSEAPDRDRRIDRILTGRLTAFPIMFLLLLFLFWLTVSAANLPSQWLSTLLMGLETPLYDLLRAIRLPEALCRMLTEGAWRVTAWVVSVMLPPMAIFFPLFTLLEDAGYLPRLAFNLDRCFGACHACGKQAMTICMGYGCNAAGVTGCRIIDSPRERLIAILTNVFAPCNGRLPMMIAVITVFLAATVSPGWESVTAAALLAAVILLGLGITFLCSFLLSRTLLRGMPSAFALELPPYRRPQIGRVLVRSLLDRTLFVLCRAVAVAAPAGLLLWLTANIAPDGVSLLARAAAFLDPLGRLMGLDGVILVAFLLGFPAAEIVIPIMLMVYCSLGAPIAYESLDSLRVLLIDNGWTTTTAICFLLFTLMHFPCSTTCLTIKKETGSWRWTAFAMLLPTALGMAACILVNAMFG